MAHRSAWIALCVILVATACSTAPDGHAAATTFVVVRHAEKASDDPRDPSLTERGRQRAAALAASLAQARVVAVYATDYRRTRQTAQPLASAHGLEVTRYDAKQAPGDFVATLRRGHGNGTVVIVGHSNTVPEIVSALCGCTVADIDESEYGNRYTVHVDPGGRATLAHAQD